MFEQKNTTVRAFVPFDAERPDGTIACLRWSHELAKESESDVLLILWSRQNVESFAAHDWPRRAPRSVLSGQPTDIGGVTYRLVTMSRRPLLSYVRRSVVIAVWLDDKTLAKIDDERPVGMCLIQPTSGAERWVRSWTPRNLLGPDGQPAAPQIDDPVARGALLRLTRSVNHNNDLVGIADRDDAIHTLRALKQFGHWCDPDELRAWAVHNGWSAAGADALHDLAEKVGEGRRLKTDSVSPYDRTAITYWREEGLADPE